ncbi:hypothetical protein [Paraburkholderia sp. Cpub6]|uniref:hypothetical protein n=1 Tax=Paraburkholderia sp. Cpub6 TaxID=2723094 RepID=UPI001616E723|nr:hypothetical protein [Paraburkholderia sp. Cpub6]MBB5456776.1 protein involved in polysaccharide export with SLBB domain [Paraburkholderia sp. Cpub6]
MDLIAVAKVVPAGYAEEGHILRATVMFTPAADGLDHSQIESWPTAVIAHLRREPEWVLPLRFKLKSGGEFNLMARARAAQFTWGRGEHSDSWVESLWRSCFSVETGHRTGLAVLQNSKAKESIKPVEPRLAWDALLQSINQSNQGTAVKSANAPAQRSDGLPELRRAGLKLVADDPTKVCKKPEATTVVSSVAAVRQTDFSVLLESQRALELMSTLHAMSADPKGLAKWSALEDKCVQLAKDGEVPGSADQKAKSAANRGEQSISRAGESPYRKAAMDISLAYGRHCPGFVCPVTVSGDTSNPKHPPISAHELFGDGDKAVSIAEHRENIVKHLSRVMSGMKSARDLRHALKEKDDDTITVDDLKDIVSQRFFTIQGSPSLSRLFGLAVDVEFEYEELKRAAQQQLNISDFPQPGFLSVSTDNPGIADNRHKTDADKAASHRRAWTLAGFDAKTRFWPATNAEASGNPSPQVDGVLVAAAPYVPSEPQSNKNDPLPLDPRRFVITSLNVPNAMEGAVDLGYQSVAQQTPGSAGGKGLRKTHQTAGLVLLDRGRDESTNDQLNRRDLHLCTQTTDTGLLSLDAQDLVIGYRIDVAVPAQDEPNCSVSGAKLAQQANDTAVPGLPWRTLMARRIEHGASGLCQEQVRQALSGLLSLPSAADRGRPAGTAARTAAADQWSQTIEDAVLGLPIRMVPTVDAKGTPSDTHVDAYVEEAVAVWNGDPMGAHCAGPVEHKSVASELATGDTISLPDELNDPHRRPPPLRFGRAYRFGIRAVYTGGISVPLSYAAKIYESTPNVTIPGHDSRDARGFRRFLRHERVDAPFLLLHEDFALKQYGAMGYERAAHVIIRSAEGAQAFRGLPGKTQRVFAPPSVEAHFANLHGSFDKYHLETLPQGLRGVSLDHEMGGFPVANITSCAGINGEVYANPPFISTKKDALGDLVYMRSSKDVKTRKKPYYPDPFAKYYVVGIRYAGTSRYLDGGPYLIPVYPGGHYPDAKPFVLNIERATSAARNVTRTLSGVLSIPAHGNQRRDQTPEATLRLRPGDDFDVDVWCIPEWQDLANCSALIEAIGAIALQSAATDGQQATHVDVCNALAALLPPNVSAKEISYCAKEDCPAETPPGWRDGFGGLWAPRKPVLQTIAQIIRSTLNTRPLNEIAAVRTVRCTHATDKPSRKPTLVSTSGKDKNPRAVHVERCSIEVPPPPIPGSTANGQPPAPRPSSGNGVQATLEYRLTGDVEVDLLSTGGLDIMANATLPTTQAFDDPQRGRSVKDKREDNWPVVDGKKLSPAHVFGFDVDADGNVTLPQGQVRLLGIDDISVLLGPDKDPDDASPARVALESYTPTLEERAASAPGEEQGIVKTRHVFPDKRARRLELRVVGKPRHAAFMRTANSGCKNDFLTSGVDLPPPHFDESDKPLIVYLESGVRPSAPLCHTPIPVFYWEPGEAKRPWFGLSKTLTRRSVIRISMSRGWFSSGVEEKLGIVVWPPYREPNDEAMLESDRVPAPGDAHRIMDLSDFEDTDLGAGGQFITRWGDDPTRPPHLSSDITKSHTFIPRSAFRDLDKTTQHGFQPEFIPIARLPVRKDNTVEKSATATAVPDSFLDVAIIAYTPRFDVRSEEWYVDVDIEHPSEAEPFVRLGLVRYQEHAAPELKVSYPIIQWTQLLPRRRVEVSVVSKPDFKEVCVAVVGQQAASTINMPIPTSGPKEPGPEHRMHVRVLRQYINAHAVRCMEIKCEKDALRNFFPDSLEAGAEVTWNAGPLVIDFDAKVDKTESATYHLHIEERDYYLPATYADEPVTPEQAYGEGVERIASGPRFAAHVVLS